MPKPHVFQWMHGADAAHQLIVEVEYNDTDRRCKMLPQCVCGDVWFNLCPFITHPAPESNQCDSGQVGLL